MTEEPIKITTKKMQVEDFIPIKLNPLQRDTERHSVLANRPPYGHLSKFSPAHAKVSIAEFPDGKQMKLDGHCRSFLWDLEALEAPPQLSVDIYHCSNLEQALAMYLTFDSALAQESQVDQLFGAMRVAKFTPSTRLFQQSGALSSMKVLVFPKKWKDAKALSIAQLTKPHIDAFKIIDGSSEFIRNHFFFPRYIFCAMLMTVHAEIKNGDGKFAMAFWEAYVQKLGTKTRDKADGIYMASDRFEYLKHEKEFRTGSHGAISKQTPYFLYYYDMWKHQTLIPTKMGRGHQRASSSHNAKKDEVQSLMGWWQLNVGSFLFPELRGETDEG